MADDIFDEDDAGGADPAAASQQSAELNNLFDGLGSRMNNLTAIANAFARAMTSAFSRSASSGRGLENVLKSLALRMSSMAVSAAFRPLMSSLFGGGGGSGSGSQ